MTNEQLIKQIAFMAYRNGGIYQLGNYNLPENVFVAACMDISQGGDGHLVEYDMLVKLGWRTENEIIPQSDFDLLNKALNGDTYWELSHIHTQDEINEILEMQHMSAARMRRLNSYSEKRRVANAYITNPGIRKALFERDGEICKHCDSIENLTLDHIVPVARGGENLQGNLQVLCKSCNSKKGSK